MRFFTPEEARKLAQTYGVDPFLYDMDEFRKGLIEEYDEHSDVIANDGELVKIVLAHLGKIPDYYTRLAKMEEEAKRPTLEWQ